MKSVLPLLAEAIKVRVRSRWICHACQRRYASNLPSINAARNLPSSPTRTRFAPSPTGYLHLGSLRTALFNFLLAKATGGRFILRVEDTDQKRTIADAENRLYEDLKWAGLEWDEGPDRGGPFGPYKQSQRTELYQRHAASLLDSGHAYRCFCSPEKLHALAKSRAEHGLPADYDRTCSSIPAGESDDRAAKGDAYVIRFKVPDTYPEFNDLVYKRVSNRPQKATVYPAFEDPILIKSDGFPTYHLANVVDDHTMEITHVVRGAEWMSSTPKHLAMYEAFKWRPPIFAHVGLLVDENNQKLSKRNFDVDIASFRDRQGILPETLINFVALLGWSHSRSKDIMSLEQLIDNFSLKFTTGNTMVTFNKLWFLQKAHATRYAAASVENPNLPQMKSMIDSVIAVLRNKELIELANPIIGDLPPQEYITKLIRADARNFTTPAEFVARNIYFFDRPDEIDLEDSCPSQSSSPKILSEVTKSLTLIPQAQWISARIKESLDGLVHNEHDGTKNAMHEIKAASKLMHDNLRWALAAGNPGPNSGDTIEILGKTEVLCRLEGAMEILKQLKEESGVLRDVVN